MEHQPTKSTKNITPSKAAENSTMRHSSNPDIVSVEKMTTDLTALIGAKDATTILTKFPPAHKGPYSKTSGGFYTMPIPKRYHQAVREMLNTIYPKADPSTARIWHSFNLETNCLWVGVPSSLPKEDALKHTTKWFKEKQEEERKAVLARIATRPRTRTAPTTASTAPHAINWGGFANFTDAESKANRAAFDVTPEARAKRIAAVDAGAAKAPPKNFDVKFKPRKGLKAKVAEKDTKTAEVGPKKPSVPPHKRMQEEKRLQEEKRMKGEKRGNEEKRMKEGKPTNVDKRKE